jgi:hypothetical protein
MLWVGPGGIIDPQKVDGKKSIRSGRPSAIGRHVASSIASITKPAEA